MWIAYKLSDLTNSRVLFQTIWIYDRFLKSKPDACMQTDSYKAAYLIVWNLLYINDFAERRFALIEEVNRSTKMSCKNSIFCKMLRGTENYFQFISDQIYKILSISHTHKILCSLNAHADCFWLNTNVWYFIFAQ